MPEDGCCVLRGNGSSIFPAKPELETQVADSAAIAGVPSVFGFVSFPVDEVILAPADAVLDEVVREVCAPDDLFLVD